MRYACKGRRAVLVRHGTTRSVSREGDCHDDAPTEGFPGGLKGELVHRTAFPTREVAKRAIFEPVEASHDRRRRRSAPGSSTPARAYEHTATGA